jgi:hypothetical protein
MRPTLEALTVWPSRLRSAAILRLPHIGLSLRTASTASMSAGGHLGRRTRWGRREPGSGSFSHRIERRTGRAHRLRRLPSSEPVGDRAAPARDNVASSLGFDIYGLRRKKTRRRPTVPDNLTR